MCRGERRSTWTWWFKSTARRSRRRRNHWLVSHAHKLRFFVKTNNKLEKCVPSSFSALLQGKLKVIASGFLSFQGAGQLREKAVSVNEGKDASIIISKKLFQCKKFQNLSEKKWKWVKLSRNGFSCQTVIYPVWPICSSWGGRSIIEVNLLPNVCFLFHWQK